jgi:enoyl-CoA hydratase/carnithine racemase
MTVSTSMHGHVAVLKLDYPDTHNALSAALVGDLLAAMRALERVDARAVVIGTAGRFFSAGANINDLRAGGWLGGERLAADPIALFEALASHPLPVVAAVSGPAIGGGFELSLCCDLAVAADTAWFATPELGLGVIPNTAMARLPEIVGRRRAMEIMCTRRRVTAGEALAMGLVNDVVPVADVLDTAVALARRIVEGVPPGALKALKRGVSSHGPTDWDRVRASVGRLPPAEWEQGLGAFLEKRPPDYEPFWTASTSRT